MHRSAARRWARPAVGMVQEYQRILGNNWRPGDPLPTFARLTTKPPPTRPSATGRIRGRGAQARYRVASDDGSDVAGWWREAVESSALRRPGLVVLAEFERELIRETHRGRAQGRAGRKFALSKAQGAAGPSRDGAPRHLRVRTVQRTRYQARVVGSPRSRAVRITGAEDMGNGGRITATCMRLRGRFHSRHNLSITVVATASSCSAVSSVCALAPPPFPNVAVVVS